MANLEFILSEAPELPGLEKRWLLNRIVCAEQEQKLRSAIEQAGHRCNAIPLRLEEYRLAWTDLGATPPDVHPWSPEFQSLSTLEQARIREYIGRAKNFYLMNNNGARNQALELGFADGATWVLPWDGGCFLPIWAWGDLRCAMEIP